MSRLRPLPLVVAIAATAAWLAGLLVSMQTALQAYLTAYLFWLGLVWGAAGLVFFGEFAGGNWYAIEHGRLRAAASLMPWVAVAFLPVAAGYAELFPWAGGNAPRHLQAFFHPLAFWGRAAIVWAAWIALTRGSSRRRAIVGMIAYFPLVTFAGIDWIMSLDAPWHSTTFGLLLAVGFTLTAFAWCSFWGEATGQSAAGAISRNDAANFTLTLVALWSYLGFTQYLIIWSGNLAVETPWYLARTSGGWQWGALVLVVTGFALPVPLLLFRMIKRNRRKMLGVLGILLVSRLVDSYWHVVPGFQPPRPLGWQDGAALLALGGWFVVGFQRNLHVRRPEPREIHERGYGV